MPVGRDVFVVDARVQGVNIQLGLDSMAALNLMRLDDTVPARATVVAGGPMLHGVGQAAVRGTVKLTVTMGTLAFPEIEFAVVDDLPVPALLGKPSFLQLARSSTWSATRQRSAFAAALQRCTQLCWLQR